MRTPSTHSPSLSSLIFPWQNSNHCATDSACSVPAPAQLSMVSEYGEWKSRNLTHWSYPKFLTTNLHGTFVLLVSQVIFSVYSRSLPSRFYTLSSTFKLPPSSVSADALASIALKQAEKLEEIFHKVSPHLPTFLCLHLLMPTCLRWISLHTCLKPVALSPTYKEPQWILHQQFPPPFD